MEEATDSLSSSSGYSSLLSSKTSSSGNCWDENSRFMLRMSLHVSICILAFLIVCQVGLFSVFYHRISDQAPISVTPFNSLVPENNTLVPCVYPRLDEDPLQSNVACPLDTFCPVGYSCGRVADQITQEFTSVCINNSFECGDIHYCTNYIQSLSEENSVVPARLSNVGISEALFITSLVIMILALLLNCGMWILFTVWTFLVGDPNDPTDFNDLPKPLRPIHDMYHKFIPKEIPGSLQVIINFALLAPLGLMILLSCTLFISGSSPSLNTLVQVSTANCFEDHWLYLFSSQILGWITAFTVLQLTVVFTIWFQLCLYNVYSLFRGIWEPRVFLTIFLLVLIILALGVGIEFFDLLIAIIE